MGYEFKLPDIGEGLHEAEVLRWLVEIGDNVQKDQPIVEVQTDKASVEITTPVAGKVMSLGGDEGDIIYVGDTLITVDEGTASVSNTKTDESDDVKAIQQRRPNVRAAPSVRKRAKELGLDIYEVEGSGKGGRILEEDLHRHLEKLESTKETAFEEEAAPAIEAPERDEERIKIRGLRKKISEKMVKSFYTAPHVTGMHEMDVTKLVQFKSSISERTNDVKLTYLPFIIKAVTRALKKYPMFNASIDDDSGEIILKKRYHIGVAAATGEGLVVPVIKDADQKTIFEIAKELESLIEKARQHTLTPKDITGGTFTITSTGGGGGWYATPIINHPEVAIFGAHAMEKKPVVVDDEIKIRQMMGVSLTFDHRIIDGEPAGRFMNEVKKVLENPEMFLLDVR